ncbi:MAG: hypothetical protein ACLRFJ_01005 [Alphaproteobacteria bacterium]
MPTKKEKFKQSTIFDQMRFNAQDKVDVAQREHDAEVKAFNECDDYTSKREYAADVKEAQEKLDDARAHYSRIVDEIKEFEK